jgi:thioredoxin 1
MKNWWKIAVVIVVVVAVVAIAQMKMSGAGVAPADLVPPASVAGSPAGPAPSPAPAAPRTPAPALPAAGSSPGTPSPPAPAPSGALSPPAASGSPPKPAASAKPQYDEPKPAPPKPAAPEATAEKPKSLPRMLDLGSSTCIPCKMMVPVMDALKQEYAGKLTVEFINVFEDRAAGEKYQIQSIPTQILFDSSGKEVFRHIGFWPKEEIVAKCKELGLLP